MRGSALPSLELVDEVVRSERQMQLTHFDSLDAKAGIILGFAGAIVALAPGGRHLVVELGRATAALAGLFALWSFWPRRYWHVDLRSLRDLYLTAEPDFARLRLLDTQISMAESLKAALSGKSLRLKLAMVALAGTAVLTAVGLALD